MTAAADADRILLDDITPAEFYAAFPEFRDVPAPPEPRRCPERTEVGRFASAGFRVIKIPPREKAVRGADARGWTKGHPPETVARHVAHGGNFGNVLGRGRAVIDVDVDPAKGKDGVASLEHLEAALGVSFAEYPTVWTGSGNGRRHIYMATPVGEHVRTMLREYPGLEFRAGGRSDGQYVVGPSSIHPSGGQYVWDRNTAARFAFAAEGEPPDAWLKPAPAGLLALFAHARPDAAREGASAGEAEPLDRIKAALDQIPVEDFGDYEKWLQVGMAVHAASGGDPEALGLWQAWSAGDPRYEHEADAACEEKWSTFTLNCGGVSMGTLISLVKEYGGKIPPPARAPAAEVFDAVEQPSIPVPDRPRLSGSGLTDTGNSARFAADHHATIRYLQQYKSWLVWDGTRWANDLGLAATAFATETVKRMEREVFAMPDSEARSKALVWALKSHGAERINAMIGLARHRVRTDARALDGDPMLLNVANGTIDLRTYELRPHEPRDLITKVVGTPYEPGARCPIWEAFLERVLPDADVWGLFKRFIGYSMQGGQEAKSFAILHGPHDGGKSTAMGTIVDTLGHAAAGGGDAAGITLYYAETTSIETFGRYHGGNRPELASLFGARLIVINEIPEGTALEGRTIKSWTGGDIVEATPKYGHPVKRRGDGTLVLIGNILPEIEFADTAMWERTVIIPFTETIPEAERDKQLRQKFNRAGVLAWMIEGHREYAERGLDVPAPCRVARDAKRAEADPLAEFWEDAAEADTDAFTSTRDLYRAYRTWAVDAGEGPRDILGRREFTETVNGTSGELRGLRWTKRQGARGWLGVKIKQTQQQDPMFK